MALLHERAVSSSATFKKLVGVEPTTFFFPALATVRFFLRQCFVDDCSSFNSTAFPFPPIVALTVSLWVNFNFWLSLSYVTVSKPGLFASLADPTLLDFSPPILPAWRKHHRPPPKVGLFLSRLFFSRPAVLRLSSAQVSYLLVATLFFPLCSRGRCFTLLHDIVFKTFFLLPLSKNALSQFFPGRGTPSLHATHLLLESNSFELRLKKGLTLHPLLPPESFPGREGLPFLYLNPPSFSSVIAYASDLFPLELSPPPLKIFSQSPWHSNGTSLVAFFHSSNPV